MQSSPHPAVALLFLLSFSLPPLAAQAPNADEVNVAQARLGATARASSTFGPGYEADNAIDGDWQVREGDKWNSAEGPGPHWLLLDLGDVRTVQRVVVRHEGVVAGGTVYDTRDFQVQCGPGPDGPWTDLVPPIAGNTRDVTEHRFAPVKLRYLRLYITRGERGGNAFGRIFEVEAFAAAATLPAAVRKLATAPPTVEFPAAFAGGSIQVFSSSHQDIAWMDSIERCIEQRDVQVITPALELMQKDPDYCFAMEDVLTLMEYLQRHPERREEIRQRTLEGRLEWGATYNQPYESLWAGESLVRQTYLGRKWLRRALPGCDTVTAWNPDVPGRALQMPQILHKAGIGFLILSRQAMGFYRWLSPDGTGVLAWSPGHYYDQHSKLRGGLDRVARNVVADMQKAAAMWAAQKLPPVFPCYVSTDAAGPAEYPELMRQWPTLSAAPRLEYSTGTRFLQAIAAGQPELPTLQGERPNVWLYIHGPTHHHAISALRDAARLLPTAETFASIEALLDGSFAGYPAAELDRAWQAHLYPDHGWGGYYGEQTDATFLAKEEQARDAARGLLDQATAAIAGRVQAAPARGTPIVVFNPLSWIRSDPVVCRLPFAEGCRLTDAGGAEVLVQRLGADRMTFVARDVPALGYATFYARAAPLAPAAVPPRPATTFENDYFRLRLGGGGIAELYDKQLGVQLLSPGKFLGGELFTMQSEGNGAGEFAEVQQPTMAMYEHLAQFSPGWRLVEQGPVRSVFELSMDQREGKLRHASVRERIIVHRELRRLDLEVELLGFDGTPWREFRLAFPVAVDKGRVTYAVPMGVVEVGVDELPGAAGERYVQACADVHPREVQDWIDASGERFGLTLASSVAVCDYLDPTPSPLAGPVLQPLLLASRKSCHGLGNFYLQAGDHAFRFSLVPHAGGWQNGWREAVQANTPLLAVVDPPPAAPSLPETLSFCELSAANLVVTALKKCDDDDSLILRCYDIAGRDSHTELRFFRPLLGIERTNLIEGQPQPASPDGKAGFAVGHHAIETFRLRPADGPR